MAAAGAAGFSAAILGAATGFSAAGGAGAAGGALGTTGFGLASPGFSIVTAGVGLAMPPIVSAGPLESDCPIWVRISLKLFPSESSFWMIFRTSTDLSG